VPWPRRDCKHANGEEAEHQELQIARCEKQSDADLRNTIVNGKGKMPSCKRLTFEQVDGLVKNIRELGKK
jgi:hypothetical protein